MKLNQRPMPSESFLGTIVKAPSWLMNCLPAKCPVKIERDKITISFSPVASISSNGQLLDSRYRSKKILSRKECGNEVSYVVENNDEFIFKI